MKNQANMPAAHSTPTMLAVATLRRRNRRSGISGSRTRASMHEEQRQQRPAPRRAAPCVCAEVQPASLPSTTAYTASISAGGDRDGAADVEPRAAAPGAVGGSSATHSAVHRDADRQVDEEDPVPAERVGQQAAEQHADAAAAGADEAVDAHRLGALGRLGEQVHDQRQRHGRDHRAAQALHRARGDQQRLRVRRARRPARRA